MSADWEAELKKMSKETEEQISKVREKEIELRKKYEGDKEKILDLVDSQLKPVIAAFRKEGLDKTDQPRVDRYQSAITLHLPIVEQGTHIGLSLSFSLIFTDTGYALTTRRGIYDHTRDNVFQVEGNVPAPVTAEGIQKQIKEFIRDRNFAIQMREDEGIHSSRRWH